jgi:pimeloyl-ACP methyl ester carboxylesterase
MSVTDLESLSFDCQGIRLHAMAAGPARGPVVMLLHGFPEFWRGWHRQIEPLAAAGYRVIVPDQRGYNLSDKPRDTAQYRLDRLAGDVIAIFDHLGAAKAFIAGHDFGAAVTWWLLTFHPDRFHAAAILNVPHPRVMQRKLQTSFRQLRMSWYMFFFQLPVLPEWWFSRRDYSVGEQVLLATSRRGTFVREDLDAYKRAWSVPGALRSMIHWYRAAFRHGLPEPRPTDWRVVTPVLILWGAEDRFLSHELAEESLRFCEKGRCVVLPGVSHWIQHEEPSRVAAELIAHFSALTPACPDVR